MTARLQASRAVDDVARLTLLSQLQERLFTQPQHRAQLLGRYQLRGRLGQGGFGVVYEAWDPELERAVAVKLVRTDRPDSEGSGIDLLEEARIAARLSHANVVAVHDVGRYDAEDGSEGVFLVMELVSGQTLATWLEQSRSHDAIHDAFTQAGRGLAAAHELGLVHRDFKPANALIDSAGRVRVADFGLAAVVPKSAVEPTLSSGMHGSVSEREPVLAGTPRYMAPEQLIGLPVGAACDQYALCLALREALGDSSPFGGDWDQMKEAKRRGPPRWPVRCRVRRAVRRVVDRGLHPEPEHRWPSLEELLEALEHARRPRRRWSRAMAVGLVVAGTTSWAAMRPVPCPSGDQQMDAIWGTEPRAAARDALLEIPAAHAPATWSTVASRLDDHTRRWATEYQASCEAARASGDPVEVTGVRPRLDCLERNRSQLAQTVAVLQSADRAVLDEAAMLVIGLPGPERCARESMMIGAVDEHTQPRALAREQLARAEVLIRAGRFDAAHELVAEARTSAEQLDLPGVEAHALLTEGSLLSERGEFEHAQLLFRKALDRALEVGEHALAVEAGAQLAFTVGVSLARYDDGTTVASIADAMGRNLDAHGIERGAALFSQAAVWRHAGRLEESEAAHREALAIRRQILAPDHPSVLASLEGLAATVATRGNLDEALVLARSVADIRREVQGEEHHRVGLAEVNVGHLLGESGDLEGAQVILAHAVLVLERALGPDHPSVVTAIQNLATVEVRLGHSERAAERLEQALESSARTLGLEHPSTLIVLGNVGALHVKLGRWEEGERELEQTLALQRQRLAADDVRHAPVMSNLAKAVAHRGDHARAIELWRGAVRLRSAAMGPQAPAVEGMRILLVEALLDADRRDEAARELEIFADPADSKHRERIEAARGRLSSPAREH